MTDRMLLICDQPADDVWLIIQREIVTLHFGADQVLIYNYNYYYNIDNYA